MELKLRNNLLTGKNNCIMKIKNIFGTVLIFAAMFSCSTESPIDELPIETGSITLHFKVGKEVNTKATYNYTTDDEKIISNYVIAIFAKNPSDSEEQWSKKIWSDFESIESADGTFNVSGITLPIKTTLKIVALVNDPRDSKDGVINDGNAEGWATYADWQKGTTLHAGQSKGQPYCTFDPKKLIKVGEAEMRFNKSGQLIDESDQVIGETVAIQLTQLAAKVCLQLQKDESMASLVVKNPIEINNVRLSSGLLNNDFSNIKEDNYKYSLKENETIENIVFYTYEKLHGSGIQVVINAEGTLTGSSGSKENQYKLDLDPEKGFIHGNYYQISGILKMEDKVNSNLRYVVSPWTPKDVNIPSFN